MTVANGKGLNRQQSSRWDHECTQICNHSSAFETWITGSNMFSMPARHREGLDQRKALLHLNHVPMTACNHCNGPYNLQPEVFRKSVTPPSCPTMRVNIALGSDGEVIKSSYNGRIVTDTFDALRSIKCISPQTGGTKLQDSANSVDEYSLYIINDLRA